STMDDDMVCNIERSYYSGVPTSHLQYDLPHPVGCTNVVKGRNDLAEWPYGIDLWSDFVFGDELQHLNKFFVVTHCQSDERELSPKHPVEVDALRQACGGTIKYELTRRFQNLDERVDLFSASAVED